MPGCVKYLRKKRVIVDNTPDNFSFTAQTNVPIASNITSNTVTITGITGVVPVTVSAGNAISINGGVYGNGGTIQNGQTLTVKTTSWNGYSHTSSATVTVGTATRLFTVTTQAATIPNMDLTLGSGGSISGNTVLTNATGGTTYAAYSILPIPKDGTYYRFEVTSPNSEVCLWLVSNTGVVNRIHTNTPQVVCYYSGSTFSYKNYRADGSLYNSGSFPATTTAFTVYPGIYTSGVKNTTFVLRVKASEWQFPAPSVGGVEIPGIYW